MATSAMAGNEMKSYIIKEGTFRIHGSAASNPSKTLQTLHQRKGLDITRAGTSSPLSGIGARHDNP
jgi:hypothetical protein